MAKIEVIWADTDLISVAGEARDLGFDLGKYDRQPADVRAFMKKAVVDRCVERARQAWRDAYSGDPAPDRDFNAVKNGVYVISIGGGFGVRYSSGCSEVMYIGRGIIANRLRSHLANWIFDMSRSLRDVPFRFYMERVGDRRSPEAFMDFEHHLLNTFSKKFNDKPLINRIHGRAGRIQHTFSGEWSAPLNNRGKRYEWEIRPTKRSTWFREFQDD